MKPKKNEPDNYKSSKKSHIVIIALGVGLGLAAAAALGLLRFTPRAYAPIAAADPDRVSPYLTHRLGPEFYNQVQLDAPFELVIEQDGLNEIIGAGVWPQWVGDVLVGQPVILFGDDTFYVMSRISYHAVSSVVTLVARPVLDPAGRLNLNIQSVRIGLVPITPLAARVAEKAVDDSAAEFDDWPGLEPIVRAIVANTPFDPAFEFSKKQIALKAFTLQPKRLRVHLAPVNKAVYRY